MQLNNNKHQFLTLLLACVITSTLGLYVGSNNALTIQHPKDTAISSLVQSSADWAATNLNISDEQLELESVEMGAARIVEGLNQKYCII